MDSLTQIVLGGAIGELVAGRKLGNKAILWGAIAGTIPDLDVIFSQMYHVTEGSLVHRGFSHSLLFALLSSPIFAFLTFKIYKKKFTYKTWLILFFFSIVTHPMLDVFTNYGTQFFWPFDWRITFNTVYVIDPLYTVPFMICVIMCLRLDENSKRRRRINAIGLIYSTLYLMWGVGVKLMVYSDSDKYFKDNNLEVGRILVTPMPLTSFYWMILGEGKDNYYIIHHSLFSKKDVKEYVTIKANKELIKEFNWPENKTKHNRDMLHFTDGYYAIHPTHTGYKFYDMRFGVVTKLTAGKSNDPLWGFGIVVDNNQIESVKPIRRESLREQMDFKQYGKYIFDK